MQEGQAAKKKLELKDVLLPNNVRPKHYELTLEPDLKEFFFDGSETIQLQVKENTRAITLHAKELEIHSARLTTAAKTLQATIQLNSETDTASFTFEEDVPEGEASLHISFKGCLNDKMCGFYRSSYTLGGETRWGATTQFEPVDARRAFPCWDEPNVKATFDVTLVAPADRVALSNMPVVSTEELSGGRKSVKFGTTPIMSTYLLAFVVGEYDYIEDATKEGVTMRCYTPVGKTELGKFALSVGVRALSFFTEKFGIAYPLPKLDMIAIPDFSAGAMENWGLVTYREAALLIDPKKSSVERKQRVARTVSHELAHQWFGNLVTMDWWTWLWLNEGFARYIEHLAVHYLFPEWDIWTQFVYEVFGGAQSLDSLKSSHAIEVDVAHPGEINEIFDTISYAKGGSVIRMLSNYLGEEDFLRGLNIYLNRHKYANATSDDLWAALSEASGKPVRDIMLSWTRKVNYPVITVESKSYDGSTGKVALSLSQRKFLITGERSEDDYHWNVPIGVKVEGSDETQFLLMTERQQTIEVGGLAREDGWIKLNAGQTGLYRVAYLKEDWDALGRAVASGALSPADRIGVENDAYALSKAYIIAMSDYLAFLENYKVAETEYPVWANIAANLGGLSSVLSGEEDLYPAFQNYVCELFRPIAERLGWDAKPDEGDNVSLFRALVLSKLGGCDDQKTVEEAMKRFESNPDDLHPELKLPVYRMVVANGGEQAYERVLAQYRASDFSEEKRLCLQALGWAKSEQLLRRTLELSMSDEVRSQDTVFPLANVAANPAGRELAWRFLQERWEDFDKRFGGGQFLISSIIGAATGRFTTEEKAKEVEEFFKTHHSPSAERTIQQSLEKIRANAAFVARVKENIKQHLAP